ncbi:hypothetical protein [Hydrogenimonas urashimensis]|uniref:hypothetical protein n=1 Tax=Hydrogenimonas urashimensis TaxID=2740515 RepID=UPI00191652DE|nr:hypothetical protein [Hydrogenimonas urashimensis]
MKIVSLGTFTKEVKRLHKKYKNIAKDLKDLEEILRADPNAGTELGRHCYKIRLANSSISVGKSGGFRVVYYYRQQEFIYLMSIYLKTELPTISDERITEILEENGLL